MGTRSLTYVYDADDNSALCCMYRQYDGYPGGHGVELGEFLKPITVVNGYGGGMKAGAHANGAGCLAAQLVSHFKEDIGGIYLYPPKESVDAGQEYTYKVFVKEGSIEVAVYEIPYKDDPKLLFKGSPEAMLLWVESKSEQDEED